MNLTYNGKNYRSLAEFAQEYGLRYPTTVAQYNKQKLSLEQIIERQKTHRNKTKKNIVVCEYDGQQFHSLFDAGEALGISPSTLYTIKKKEAVSPSEAIDIAMKRRSPNRGKGRCKAIIVNGVSYESQTAALEAYEVPAVTVTTRMRREGISFEEALLRGSRNKKRIRPNMPNATFLKAEKLNPITIEELDDNQLALYEKIEFQSMPIELFCDGNNSIVIKTEERIGENNKKIAVYFIYHKNEIEILVPDLVKIQKEEMPEDFFETLAKLNEKYLGLKVGYHRQRHALYVSSSVYGKPSIRCANTMIGALFSILYVCDELAQFFPIKKEAS